MPARPVFMALALLPLFAPSLLSAISFIYIFGNQGFLKGWLMGASVYGPIEERCRDALGDSRFDQLAAQGAAMTHDQLMDRVGAEDLRPVPAAG